MSPRSVPHPVPIRARSSTSRPSDAGVRGLGRQTQGVGHRALRVLHRRVQDGAPEPEIQTEHDAVLAHRPDDGPKVGERPKGLQADHDLARPGCEHLERALRRVRAGVHHDRAGKPGIELRQLPQRGALDGAALDGVQVGDVARPGAEPRRGRRA